MVGVSGKRQSEGPQLWYGGKQMCPELGPINLRQFPPRGFSRTLLIG